MRKKIIFVVFSLILFLIFTAVGYAWGPKPKYLVRGHPWDRCLSPRIERNLNLGLIVVPINPGFYLMFPVQSNQIYQNSQTLLNRRENSSQNHGHLKKNERKSQE
jgi:hypothetical protein